LLCGPSSLRWLFYKQIPTGLQSYLRHKLTAREREVVQLIAEGRTTKEVASVLNISIKTAETHRANLMRKLDVHSVTGLIRYAVKNQIIET